jgi:iron(III) transport system permease protein
LAAVTLGATALAALPLGYLVIRAGSDGWAAAGDTLWRLRTLELVLRSVELALVVTGLSLVLGVGLALLVSRTDLPGARIWQVALALPLALPSYVSAWSWIGAAPGLAGRAGAVLVLTTISYPFVYLPVLAALRRCDTSLEDVARSLGCRRGEVLLRVTVPQIRTAAAGGGLLVGLYALSDFGAVATMRHEVLTHVIYRSYRGSFDRTPAAVLGCVLAALALVVVALEARTRRRAAKVGSGAPRPQRRIALGARRWPAVLVPVTVLAVCLGVPLWGLLTWTVRGTSSARLDQVVPALGNSLLVGAAGALVVVALAFPMALLAERYPGRLSRLGGGSAYAGHALPGVVVGLALVFFGVRYAPGLYQELPMLIVAYAVLFLSLGLAALQSALSQVPPALEEVARSLGRTRWRAWREITLRLSAPGAGAAATLVFLTVMKELPATLFLRPTGFDTLATRLWGHVSAASYAAAAPYALLIVVVAALPAALLATAGEERARR